MKKLDVIEDGQIRDYLSLVHLAQKFDKSHRPIENQFRCTVDMTEVNKIFAGVPYAIPSAPQFASSLASYSQKVILDLTDVFFHQ